jgi:hypothetical protein
MPTAETEVSVDRLLLLTVIGACLAALNSPTMPVLNREILFDACLKLGTKAGADEDLLRTLGGQKANRPSTGIRTPESTLEAWHVTPTSPREGRHRL